LNDILREEWGFKGMVVTDWGGMNDRIEGFRAGNDLNMPGGSDYMAEAVVEAVRSGKLPESAVDACARRVIELMMKHANKETKDFDKDAHHHLARKMAESGAVLLKNEGILPLNEDQKVAIIGSMAKNPRYQGAGSSHINPIHLVTPYETMRACVYAAGCDDKGNTTDELIKEAMEIARQVDVAVVFAGLPDNYESEGFDRNDMKMPEGHVRMIKEVAKVNPNTVVVLLCGSAVECDWADEVKAILYMGLGGQAVGEATKNLLYGKVNPSGKLSESWPYRYEDCVCSDIYGTQDALYMEGIYVGYRYYEKTHTSVRYPFGYGLSYTTFEYSDLNVSKDKVTVMVKNTGELSGAEVVQMYVKVPEDSGYRAVRELKGFKKVFLNPGECTRVEFELEDRCFAIYQKGWVVPRGNYQIQIGTLSEDYFVEGETVTIVGEGWYKNPMGKPIQSEWESYLGHKYVPKKLKKGEFTMDNSVMEMKDYSLVMKIMYMAVANTIGKGFPKEERTMDNPNYKMLILSSAGGPVRGMQISGAIKGGLFRGLVEMANGHYIRGIMEMMKKG
ncbi:MAG: beta-glucosidase, partial [Erysipelotrichaceae bacterium]|nr:beta-glucosidase [Erysipelotrichaceae bacterium]